MKNNASFVYSFFLVIGDFVALMAAFLSAFLIRGVLDTRPVAHPVAAITYLGIFVALIPFWLIIFGLLGLYNSSIYEKRFQEIGRLFMGSFVGFLFVIAAAYFSNEIIFPAKLIPIYGLGLAFLFLVLFRNIARGLRIWLFRRDIGISNLLIIGGTKIAKELVDSLRNSRESGYRILGVVSSRPDAHRNFPDIKVFSDFESACKNLGKGQIHGIVQTELYGDSSKNNQILNYSQEQHVSYRFIPGNTELFVGNIEVELFRSSVPVIAVHQTALVGWGRIIKRLFDLVVTVPLVLLLSPVFLLVILAELIFGGKGKVLFKQIRLTRYNRQFNAHKFRTIRQKYNGLTPEQAFAKMGEPALIKEFRDNGDFLVHDPRLTSLGRFLRTTSLDELPQLFNILKGDISLVGPRALVPQELDVYDKRHAILSVKSGLTGLAQVSGRKNISFNERRKLDIYYVQNWSFWLDIVILLKTVRVIFSGS
jgi:exopolysaccharide biosynthesis polyprenyl glycosylphosphotransferase